MKRSIGIILVLALSLFSLASCKASSPSAEECCGKVVSLMQDMLDSDSYLDCFGSRSYSEALVDDLKAHKKSSPSAIYELDITNVTQLFGDDIDTSDFSDTLKDHMDSAKYRSLAAYINTKSGSDAISTTSALTAQMVFDCKEVTKSTAFLYIYEDGYPILFSVTKGEADSVSICGTFLIASSLCTSDQNELIEAFDLLKLHDIALRRIK